MKLAYVDTSALVAIAFDEPRAREYARKLDEFERLVSSNLLEAELRAVFQRENMKFRDEIMSRIDWILPNRPLASEFNEVLRRGYLRGADLWHVATALFVAPKPGELSFASLDVRQCNVAGELGFRMPL